jgi:hypothetical protein
MKKNLSKDHKFQKLIEKEVLNPIFKILSENNYEPNCKVFREKIKSNLEIFATTAHSRYNKLKDNSTYICFDNLKSMYLDNVIPENIFWITCVNANTDDSFTQPNTFIEQLNIIIKQIKSNSFELTHEWHFDHEGNSGVFLHFIKPVNNTHHFISIFIAYKNIDDEPTFTEVKNEEK